MIDELTAEERQTWDPLAYLMIRLPATLESQMQQEAGISHFEYLVLASLYQSDAYRLRMSDLADYIASSLSRLSNVVARLEDRGWVRRYPDPDDGRATIAELAEAGIAKYEASTPAYVEQIRSVIFAPLNKPKQRQLAQIARLVLQAIDPDAPCVRLVTSAVAAPE